jgi:hypothetical protein
LAAFASILVSIQPTTIDRTDVVAAVMPIPASTQPPAMLNLSTIGFTDMTKALSATRNAIFLWLDRSVWMNICDVENIIKSSCLNHNENFIPFKQWPMYTYISSSGTIAR